MSAPSPYRALIEALRCVGVRAIQSPDETIEGFPLNLRLNDGSGLTLDVPEPDLVSHFDEEHVGLAIVDSSGSMRKAWGMAARIEHFRDGDSVLETPLGSLVRSALKGVRGSLHLDDRRYYAAPIRRAGRTDALILSVDARDEGRARKDASLNERKAAALKLLGKALTMNQTLQPMALAAVHAISSAMELAAVLLWVRSVETGPMELVASVGANRAGTGALAQLDTEAGMGCAAELAAVRQEPLVLRRVEDSPITAQLEARFCYLKPGGLIVFPLLVGQRLIGLLEVIARQGDDTFLESEDLFATVAEHLALALNSAIMFESVERLAAFDPLTGIANHRTMQEFLQKRVIEAQRSGGTVGVVMIDVDHFRSFNEDEGHDAGDRVLKLVAEVLRSTIRPYDLAARYGGEEFTVVMPGTTGEATWAVAERVRTRIEQLRLETSSGRARHVTASLGCAVFPNNAEDASGILKAADTALYEAKRAGRNRTVQYQGRYRPVLEAHGQCLAAARRHVPDDLAEPSEDFLRRCRPYILHLASEIAFTEGQVEALCAAALLTPAWRRWLAEGDGESTDRVRQDSCLRAVAACLADAGERFDGAGPMGLAGKAIPLLPRALAVVVAIALEEGLPFERDPGRFDPELVAAIGGFEEAA